MRGEKKEKVLREKKMNQNFEMYLIGSLQNVFCLREELPLNTWTCHIRIWLMTFIRICIKDIWKRNKVKKEMQDKVMPENKPKNSNTGIIFK